MPYADQSTTFAGVGFSFDVPIPMSYFGHRIALAGSGAGFRTLLLVEQTTNPRPAFGGFSIQGDGLRFHERDRFGVVSYSRIQLRFAATLDDMVEKRILAPLVALPIAGQRGAMLTPTRIARMLCAQAVNRLVDIHTLAFSTFWLPHVTEDDLFHVQALDWSNPTAPSVIALGFGSTDGSHLRFGMGPDYPCEDREALQRSLRTLPLSLAEEIHLQALRDLHTLNLRSAVLHLCLGFEAWVRELLTLNADSVPDKGFEAHALKKLCTSAGCLPALIGAPLDNKRHAPVRDAYLRIAQLRDAVMHRGILTYRWRPTQQDPYSECHIEVEPDVVVHFNLVADLRAYISDAVAASGHRAPRGAGVVI